MHARFRDTVVESTKRRIGSTISTFVIRGWWSLLWASSTIEDLGVWVPGVRVSFYTHVQYIEKSISICGKWSVSLL
jgi:hypothetical protein